MVEVLTGCKKEKDDLNPIFHSSNIDARKDILNVGASLWKKEKEPLTARKMTAA